jgi:hypothetical protein
MFRLPKVLLLFGLCVLLSPTPAPGLVLPEELGACADECRFYGDCYTKCKDTNGLKITCDLWFNRQAGWDYDGDGDKYPADNCGCVANANQANCDGDARGDACDALNQLWVLEADLGFCDSELDSGVGYSTIKVWGQKRYRDQCTGTTCLDRYTIKQATCLLMGEQACCEANAPDEYCSPGPGCGNDCPF